MWYTADKWHTTATRSAPADNTDSKEITMVTKKRTVKINDIVELDGIDGWFEVVGIPNKKKLLVAVGPEWEQIETSVQAVVAQYRRVPN